jgi:hypothetical protein
MQWEADHVAAGTGEDPYFDADEGRGDDRARENMLIDSTDYMYYLKYGMVSASFVAGDAELKPRSCLMGVFNNHVIDMARVTTTATSARGR